MTSCSEQQPQRPGLTIFIYFQDVSLLTGFISRPWKTLGILWWAIFLRLCDGSRVSMRGMGWLWRLTQWWRRNNAIPSGHAFEWFEGMLQIVIFPRTHCPHHASRSLSGKVRFFLDGFGHCPAHELRAYFLPLIRPSLIVFQVFLYACEKWFISEDQ